jgi:hypothetical protein
MFPHSAAQEISAGGEKVSGDHSIETVVPPTPPAKIGWWKRQGLIAKAAADFDRRWWRWIITGLFLSVSPMLECPHATVKAAGKYVAVAAGLSMCLYFAHLLFRRIQCSLLELLVMMAFLGNAVGLILTMPGVLSAGKNWLMLLLPMIGAWVFYGALKGLIQAEILGATSPLKRLFFLLAGWLNVATPALFCSGIFLHVLREERSFAGSGLDKWSLPLVALGVIGLIVRLWLGMKTMRAAKKLLVFVE